MEKKLDAVLIDDDSLVHLLWELSASLHDKIVAVFSKPDDFLDSSTQIPFETPIYIDSYLSPKIKGEKFAKNVYEAGFKNLYLTTGFDKDEFAPMYWLKDILDKNPPWE